MIDMISNAEHPASASRRHAAFRSPCGDDFGGRPAFAAASEMYAENAFSDLAAALLLAMNVPPSLGHDFRKRASSA
ncbi:hypothetical protein [Mesorhizobium sp. YM1C-6-2]|uniref:hypothetical protein n=1 Tax=Mesorhizobium sp. YM1C-6-2 TaxID=1827501 RepID=UPI001FE0EDFF|nr:hypothetical protein [Mesorhizobium sp. YM1C-6-2]